MENNYQADLEVGAQKTSNLVVSDAKEEFINNHKTSLNEDDITMFKAPNKGCKKCHGTGVEGIYDWSSKIRPGDVIICRCITNQFGKSFPNGTDTTEYLSYGEFRKMMKNARLRFNLQETQYDEVPSNTIQSNDQEVDIKGDTAEQTEDSSKVVGEDSNTQS
jgi:hypothetical protein